MYDKESVTLDGDLLRQDLLDYYGIAMMSGMPMAMMEVSQVEYASGEELLQLAEQAGFDLNDYVM